MFYETDSNRHGLKFDPFKALMAPRPIGWISTVSAEGIHNLAPYSFFNAVSDNPPVVMFSSVGMKDSLHNIEANGEFTCSIATYDLREQMNLSSAPVSRGVDEFKLAGLTATPGKQHESVRAPQPLSVVTGRRLSYRIFLPQIQDAALRTKSMWCLVSSSVFTLMSALSKTAWSIPLPCSLWPAWAIWIMPT
jgi:flavin reductase (DIM6/NTAB) family NADH-FMN oxidoreductase RutF